MNIVPVSSDAMLATIQATAATSPPERNGLFDRLLDQVNGLNTQLISADHSVQQLANGETENLHQVVLGLEQTRMAFDLALQVRNKVLDAYQEVMRMQV